MSAPTTAKPQRIVIQQGDCVERLKELDDDSIDAIVCDPPYFIGFMGKTFDIQGDASKNPQVMQETHMAWLTEAFRVLKPGGVIKAMSGSRTFHRLAKAMQAVGFEILPREEWTYASGFPKSLSVSKALDKKAGVEREVLGTVAGMGKQNPEWNGTAKGRKEDSFKPEYEATAPASDEAILWDGYGTALKPSHEPVICARKPRVTCPNTPS